MRHGATRECGPQSLASNGTARNFVRRSCEQMRFLVVVFAAASLAAASLLSPAASVSSATSASAVSAAGASFARNGSLAARKTQSGAMTFSRSSGHMWQDTAPESANSPSAFACATTTSRLGFRYPAKSGKLRGHSGALVQHKYGSTASVRDTNSPSRRRRPAHDARYDRSEKMLSGCSPPSASPVTSTKGSASIACCACPLRLTQDSTIR
mmetsp:Transcript_15670/g.27977  ORF Transcript_15670/g.27977 Transcript_15670/m.27977 type:complete len:211 (-) Transcript_15670:100-732(-)